MATNLANISIKDSSSWKTYLDLVYPVGAIYMSFSNASPAELFGGTWGWIDDYFFRAGGNTETGGSNTHTLTVSEIPLHTHSFTDQAGVPISAPSSVPYLVGSSQGSGRYFSRPQTGPGNGTAGQAHNNMPKYQNVFCWKRTA